jgi:hypothetical protein
MNKQGSACSTSSNTRLRANQHEVFALTRSPDSAPALKEIGAEGGPRKATQNATNRSFKTSSVRYAGWRQWLLLYSQREQ